MVTAVAPVAAQTNSTATATPTASSTATTNETASTGYLTRIDGDAVVVDAEHDNGSIVLTIRSEVYKSATVSGTVGGEPGGGSFAIKTVELFEGETTVRIAAPMIDGEATATVVTTSCVDAGRCGYVQIGDAGGGSLLTGGSTVGWLGGAFTALLATAIVVWSLVRRGDDAPEEL